MLKYQVRTLNRGKARRKSILDPGSTVTLTSPCSLNSSSSTSSGGEDYPLHSPSTSHSSSSSQPHPLRARSSSVSSLSSVGSSSESSTEWGTVRVYTGLIRADTDYKTMFVNNGTSAGDLVRMVLSKFRITQKDSKLYHLTMEIKTKREGVEMTNVLVLDSSAKPLELQACHPRDKSRFLLVARNGQPVRIHDVALNQDSNYRSIMVSEETTCAEAVHLLLHSHRLPLPWQNFALVSVHTRTGYEYILPPEARIAEIKAEGDEFQQIHIRPFSRGRTQAPPPRRPPPTLLHRTLPTHIENSLL